jgi:hypothetical protein
MSNYSCYVGEAIHGSRRFKPKGRLKCYQEGVLENPVKRENSGGLSARFFVGLNVKKKTVWKVDDVIAIVRRVRKKQKQDSSASILAQKGIYEDRATKQLVVEPSVQVIIVDLAGTPKPVFTKHMTELAEVLQKKLKQDLVILEIQKRGVVVDVYSAVP